MKTTRILGEKVQEEMRQIAQESGCELLAVETAGAGRHLTLRLVLDKPEGVTLEDCERVSRDVSPLLDAEANINHQFHLEVSSPGLDRRLYSEEDARRFLGRRLRVRMKTPIDGSRNFRGRLEAVSEDGQLRVVDEEGGKTYNLSFRGAETARLEAEWPGVGEKRKKK
jgi:ribosome maturation factor RimP